MKLVTSPEICEDFSNSVFLGGGISNCSNWQELAIDYLESSDITVINPRRQHWNMNSNVDESIKQIQWEYYHIQKSEVVLFWFPHETLCPITLYELGSALRTHENIFVGCSDEYARRIDVVEQVRLVRPDINVRNSVEDICSDVAKYFSS